MGHPATPSRACEPCRAKRRRCDLRLPGCAQCRRANISCPGYRDSFSLRIRDQTTAIARKVQERGRIATLDPPTPATECSCTPPQRTGLPASRLESPLDASRIAKDNPDTTWSPRLSNVTGDIPYRQLHVMSLSTRPEEAAVDYYMISYAPAGSFDYLPELLPTLDQSQLLHLALLAPSLTVLSQDARSPELQRLAYAYYARALKKTNSALSDPRLVSLDSTLLAVLLLSLFEALVFRGRRTPENWNAHTQGSVALLCLRGEKQLRSPLGRHLFLHACGNIITSYAQRCIKTPHELKSLQGHLARITEPTHPGLRIGAILGAFADIRADANSTPPSRLLQRALGLEDDMAALLRDSERQSPFEVIDATSLAIPTYAYHNHIYRYRSQRSARQWDVLQVLRLFLNELIHELTFPCDADESLAETLASHARLRAEKAVSGILYSVPFALELSNNLLASARMLIYPLSGVAVSPLAPPPAIAFARNRLAFIGQQCGLTQATESAAMVSQATSLEDWIHLSLLL